MNPLLSLTQFLAADENAKPEETIVSPLRVDDDYDHTMKHVIDMWIKHQSHNGRNDYFSFSIWDDGHSINDHRGTTALIAEYEEKREPAVKKALAEIGLSYYVISTKAGRRKCKAFVFPVKEPMSDRLTIRSASLIIEAIGVGGLTHGCHMPTYFFKFQQGTECEWVDNDFVWSDRNVDDMAKVITDVQRWVKD